MLLEVFSFRKIPAHLVTELLPYYWAYHIYQRISSKELNLGL